MTTGPLHIATAIPAAIAALTAPPSLEQQCANLDTSNPHALKHWTLRIRAMRRFPGADEALRCLLFEVASRRTDRQAKSKGYTNPVTKPAAWLNHQTLVWLNKRKLSAAETAKGKP